MHLIDSHCHLHDTQFFQPAAAEAALKKAAKQNVKQIVCVGTDLADSCAAQKFAASHQGVFWSFGVHPSEWRTWQSAAADVRSQLVATTFQNHPPSAIGEVGLDYHYGSTDRAEQLRLFEQMLDLASQHYLPVIFHVREAFDDFFAVIANFPNLTGVVHSFTDNKKNLRRSLELGFYIGVNGLATYSTLPTPPLERILLETDAPFLTPEPFRGTINEPAYIREIAAFLTTKLGVSEQIIAEQTTQNVQNLFRLSSSVLCS